MPNLSLLIQLKCGAENCNTDYEKGESNENKKNMQ